MLILGLTGPSGAGKGVVSELLASHGLSVINADEIYHCLLLPPSPCLDEIVGRFGQEVLSPDGTLDREALGKVVFSDPAALADLNSISHRYVMETIFFEIERLRRKDCPAVVLDAPQLFEAGADRLCTVVISVLADKELRLERIVARDGIDRERAMRRIAAQRSDEFFRVHSDYVIENNGDVENLSPRVRSILEETGVLTP